MKLIEPKFEILEQAPGLEGMYNHIERCGRVAYKSEDKITEDSANGFVERMKSNQHFSVLEHGTVYLKMNGNDVASSFCKDDVNVDSVFNSHYTRVQCIGDVYYLTTNLRVIEECDAEPMLKYISEPTEYHEKRVTVRFNTDIGISREFNRHRANSVTEMSTRYCNFSKDKFGNELSVVPPIRAREQTETTLRDCRKYYGDDLQILAALCNDVSGLAEEGEYDGSKEAFTAIDTWLFANFVSQWAYMRLTNKFGWSAQEARSVLPLDTATELVHTAYVSDWEHFFALRCDSHAHPMARELAIPLREEFLKRRWI